MDRYLVTGALGCIGAWTVRLLLAEGHEVWTYDLGTSDHRLRLIMDDAAIARVHQITGDITDYDAFDRAVAGNGITHIIHLAALQVPFVRANPVLGARVNLVGMAIVLEVTRQRKSHVQGLSFASSIAVYGPDRSMNTATLYGVHKQAKEGMARIYWQDHGVRSIGLRPHTVYGPGRDQGITSIPTKAMLAAAIGREYRINYGGSGIFHHAEDTARAFIKAVRTPYDGAPTFDMGGPLVSIDDIIAAIEAAVPGMKGKITHDANPLPVTSQVDTTGFDRVIGEMSWMPIGEGVRRTIEDFRAAVRSGRIDVDKALA